MPGRRGSKHLVQALPLRELRPAADVVGQVLVAGVLPGVEEGVLESRRDDAGVHALRPAPYDAAADAGGVDRLAGHGDARGGRAAGGAPGGQGVVMFVLVFVVRIRERAVVRALRDGPPNCAEARYLSRPGATELRLCGDEAP
ncbi:hypothetical protein [Streptomyces phaeoluteigriseus]|uniref:hypothetical protein n=1 Tax=Streptomyces phaeoluteigriseus TaxID=114686 RepID=UPI001301C75C|nr:hypothetical protein [Streptomyces phaeoluteigriseus]